jgi:Ni,Fe-hydrogenase III large subunit
MSLRRWWDRSTPLPGRAAGGRVAVEHEEWYGIASDAAAASARFLSLWVTPLGGDASGAVVRCALLVDGGVLVVELELADAAQRYRGLETLFPAAARMQRAAADLTGFRADAPDQRPWLRHAAWQADAPPLRSLPPPPPDPLPADDYAFVRVGGDGVHEIAVGPVHAGIIEPGHFRFSVVGEKVLRLEERLGYVHKGVARRFTELAAVEGHRLAARVSGDTAVAFAWAYCQALEAITASAVPARGQWLRGVFLELERLQNHLGDLGALGNDAGFAFGLAQFSRLKEELTRTMAAELGARYLLDAVVPGGVARDLPDDAAMRLSTELGRIGARVRELHRIYDDHSGVRDRFAGAGAVAPELAQQLGLTGFAGRASAQAVDLRVDAPWSPYHVLAPTMAVRRDGDVAARVAVRFDEVEESCRLARAMLDDLPPGPCQVAVEEPRSAALGIGLIEGWRGPVMIALETARGGRIHRCHAHDPSWQNWPALEYAVIGNIVPDFPLINKSFNLSYSGHDG